MEGRSLKPEFFNAFLEEGSECNRILKIVKDDNDLMMCLRGSYVSVYYKGLRILEIKSGNRFFVHENYGIDPNKRESWERYFEVAKTALDSYGDQEKLEKEIQQRIARENNYGGKSAGTDYYIFDIEYTPSNKKDTSSDSGKGRFDALAFCWPTRKRRKGDNLQLAFIEVKVGENSLKGRSGVSGHYKSVAAFLDALDKNEQEKTAFLNDMDTLIGQLRQLGLLKILTSNSDEENPHQVTISREAKPQLIFAIANYSPNSITLKGELQYIREYNKERNTPLPFELLFATSPCIGYAFYGKYMLGLDAFAGKLA